MAVRALHALDTVCNPVKIVTVQSVILGKFYSTEDTNTAAQHPVWLITIHGLNGTAYSDKYATKTIMGKILIIVARIY